MDNTEAARKRMSIGNVKVGAGLVGLAAACVACCTLPVAATFITLASLAGIGTTGSGWWVGLVAIGGVAIAGGLLLHRRRTAGAKRCAAASDACGCGTPNDVVPTRDK